MIRYPGCVDFFFQLNLLPPYLFCSQGYQVAKFWEIRQNFWKFEQQNQQLKTFITNFSCCFEKNLSIEKSSLMCADFCLNISFSFTRNSSKGFLLCHNFPYYVIYWVKVEGFWTVNERAKYCHQNRVWETKEETLSI